MLKRSDASPEERELRARATVTLALAEFERKGLAAADALLGEARALLPGPDGTSVRVLAAIQEAGLLGRTGDWEGAVSALTAIGPDAAEVSPRAHCVVALNTGLARQFLMQFEDSGRDLSTALELAIEHGFPDLEFMARHNLGHLELIRGNLPLALRLMAEADAMEVDVGRSTSKLDNARALLEAGLLDEAEQLLDQAEEIAVQHGLHHDRGEILLERARRDLLVGDHRQALRHAGYAVRAFRRRSAPGWRLQAEVMRLQAALAAGSRSRQLVREAERLADVQAQYPTLRHQAAVLAAEAEVQAGDADSARSRLASAAGRSGANFPAKLHELLVDAMVSLADGDRRRAVRTLRAAAERLALEQSGHASLDTRTALALHGRRASALDIGLALESGSPSEIFVATERWRAVSQRLPPMRPPDDPDIAELSARLRQARVELRQSESAASEEPLRVEIARLERSIARRGWELAGAPEHGARSPLPLQPIRLSSLKQALASAGSDFVSFLGTGGRLRALTIEAGRARLVELGGEDFVAELVRRLVADLAVASRPLPEPMRATVERSLERSLSSLDDLLRPAIPEGSSRLVVLSSRTLPSVPWPMLPSLAGRAVTVAPSATWWAKAAGQNEAHRPKMAALSGPALTRGAAEVRAVSRVWKAGPGLTGAAATGDALTTALRDSRVVHVAAHGSHHEQSPLFSSVQMADGPVFAYEFQRVGVGAEHVVLSACDVGRAVVRQGEEALGLTASLMACGVRSVVASVAPIGDAAAERAMTAYHQHLAGGLDAAAALEASTRQVPEARTFCAFGADWSV